MASQYSSIMNMIPAQSAKASYASRGFGDTQAKNSSNAQYTSSSFESHLKSETARQDTRSERSNAADSGQIRNVRGTETARSERQAAHSAASEAKADNRSQRADRTDASPEAPAEPSSANDDSATANVPASETAAAPAETTATDTRSEQTSEETVADAGDSTGETQVATLQPENLPQTGDLPTPDDQMVAPPAPPLAPTVPDDSEAMDATTDGTGDAIASDSEASDAVAAPADDTPDVSADDQDVAEDTPPPMPTMAPVAGMPGAVPPPIVADADSSNQTVEAQPSAPVPPRAPLEDGAEASGAAEQAANTPESSDGQSTDQPSVTAASGTGAGSVDAAALPDAPQPATPPMAEDAASAVGNDQQPPLMPPLEGSEAGAANSTDSAATQVNQSTVASSTDARDVDATSTSEAATETELASAAPSSIDTVDATAAPTGTRATDAAAADTGPAPAEAPLKPAPKASEQPDDAMDAIASSQTAEETTDTAAVAVSDEAPVADADASDDSRSIDGHKHQPQADSAKADAAVMAAAAAKADDAEVNAGTDTEAETAKTNVTAAQQAQVGSTTEAGAQIAKAQGRQTADGQQQPATPPAQANQTAQTNATGSQTRSDVPSANANSDAAETKPEESRSAARNAPKGEAFSKMMAMVDDKATITTNSTGASDLTSSTMATASSTVRLTSMDGLAQTGQTAQQISLANSNAIAAEISKFARKGETRFEIRLDPADLGKIDVRMTIGSDGHTRTHLYVERPETLDMLMRDQRFLERSLQQSGVNLQNQSLDYSLMDQGNQGWQMAGQDQSAYEQDYSDQSSATEESDDTTISAPQTSRYAAHYVATGGLNLVI